MDLTGGIGSFHFLRPAWLLALPLLLMLALWLARWRAPAGAWAPLIDAPLLAALRLHEAKSAGGAPWPWLALAWALTSLALAGPTWERETASAWRAPDAWVLVLDLSPSMSAADLQPDRATRARYALRDLLEAAHGARVGLVVFGDEAFAVTPLTDDMATVRGLLDPLAPAILPSAGDRLAPALALAQQLLERTATRGGHVLVLSDGFADPAAAFAAAARLRSRGSSVDVLGIGTAGGAPEPAPGGGFIQDAQGRQQMARLDADLLRHLASAGGGQAYTLEDMPALIATLQVRPMGTPAEAAGQQAQRWRDAGVWLLPALLLLAAPLARRGWL